MTMGMPLVDRWRRRISHREKPSNAGHHHVHHNQVGQKLSRLLERLQAAERAHHVMASLLQVEGNQFEEIPFIVRHQYFAHEVRVPRLNARWQRQDCEDAVAIRRRK